MKVLMRVHALGYRFTLVFKKQLVNWFYIGPRGVVIDAKVYGKNLWDLLLHYREPSF